MTTLGADYREIQEEMGFFLGFGRDITQWAADDLASVVAWIKAGLRRFLFAAYQPKLENVYEWSFLKQDHFFGTQIGQTEYDLPANFGSPDGPILWASNTLAYRPIEFMNEAFVRAKLSLSTTITGIPLIAANFQKPSDGAQEQRQALVIWPKPDASYPLRMSYNILPGALTDTFPWPPGGSPHADALMWACLAAACKKGDDRDTYEASYQMALMASINYDARQNGQNTGYCGDPKQREYAGWPSRLYRDEEAFTDLKVLVHNIQY